MKMIVAVDKEWAIGKEGNLLCYLPGDLKYFKENTEGKTIILGRKTLEGFPNGKPLPNRINIILTRDENVKNKEFDDRDYIFLSEVEDVLRYIEDEELMEDDIFVSGGETIYKQFLPFCDEVLVTKIDKTFGGDTFFPNIDIHGGFTSKEISDDITENGITYKFFSYKR